MKLSNSFFGKFKNNAFRIIPNLDKISCVVVALAWEYETAQDWSPDPANNAIVVLFDLGVCNNWVPSSYAHN